MAQSSSLKQTIPPKPNYLAVLPAFPLIYLRHGQHVDSGTYRGISDDPLSEEGERQANITGNYLARYFGLSLREQAKESDYIELITGPLPRTRQTTEIVSSALTRRLGLPVQLLVDGRITEFYTPPPAQGMPIKELNRLYRGNPMRHPLYFTNHGEPPEEISSRVGSFLTEMSLWVNNNGHTRLPRVVVTHGGILQFVQHLYGLFDKSGIGLIDKDDPMYPYTPRGDGFMATPNSIRRLYIQNNSRKL